MPHIIVETDQETAAAGDLPALAGALHNRLAGMETVNKAAIKTRVLIAEASVVGEAETSPCLVITVKLLAGRSPALKEQIADALIETARPFVIAGSAISAEIIDLQTYRKT